MGSISTEPMECAYPSGMRQFRPEMLLFFIGLMVSWRGSLPLLEPEESRYAEIPRQMLEASSFVVPVLDGQAYLDKPPLLYWLVMLSYSVFGVSVFSARIVPTAIAAAIVPLVYRWGRHLGGGTAGWMAAAIILTIPDAVYRTPMLTMNGLLALTTTAAAAFGQMAFRSPSIDLRWGFASAVACGLGVLAKGPVAVILVSPLAVLFLSQRTPWRTAVVATIAYAGIVTAVAGPWFALVAAREPDFVRYFFWQHHVERTLHPFDHVKPCWFYLPQVVVGMLPWWPLCLAGLRYRCSSSAMPLLFAFFALAFFSFAGSKRPVYLVPMEPPLAVGLGVIAARVLTPRQRGIIVGMMAVGLALALVFWLPGYHRRFSIDDLFIPTDSLPLLIHAHAWPAAEFHRHEQLRYLDDAALAGLPEPRPDHSLGILTTPAQLSRVEQILRAKPGSIRICKNDVAAIVIWTSPTNSDHS